MGRGVGLTVVRWVSPTRLLAGASVTLCRAGILISCWSQYDEKRPLVLLTGDKLALVVNEPILPTSERQRAEVD